MKRIEWIDTAKGFGILLVILGHVILLNPSSNSNDLRLSAIIYSFHCLAVSDNGSTSHFAFLYILCRWGNFISGIYIG